MRKLLILALLYTAASCTKEPIQQCKTVTSITGTKTQSLYSVSYDDGTSTLHTTGDGTQSLKIGQLICE